MLNFIRQYQRYFFVVIAIIMVASFAFFGTFSSMQPTVKIKDTPVGKCLNGSMMMRSEIDSLSRLLWSDRFDVQLAEKGVMPNYFNDGVIRKDLLASGLGFMLSENYFDLIKDDLQTRVSRYHTFRPYVHPTAPFISVEQLWNQVMPSQTDNLHRLQHEMKTADVGMLKTLIDLYVGETEFPSNILREYLIYQQNHYSWIHPDPHLASLNLNLFHATSLEDWFGPTFIELCSQFILNAAAYASTKGYAVSYDEARVDWIRNGYESLQVHKRKTDIAQSEVEALVQEQLAHLGLQEKAAVEAWQKVMLFRRLFHDHGKSVFLDGRFYRRFHQYASKAVSLESYSLPSHLQLKDFESLLKLQVYIDHVSEKPDGLMLPQNFKSCAEIAESAPSLLESRFLVEMASVNIDEVALSINLKEMWQWQVTPENFSLLEKNFPILALRKGDNAQSYHEAIENLSPDIRQQVDQFSRRQIVLGRSELIQDALSHNHFSTQTVSFSPTGDNTLFASEEEGKALLAIFKKAALKDHLESQGASLEARRALEKYSPDGATFYRFHLLDREVQEQVLTFEEACQRGVMTHLLDQMLSDNYPTIREKHPKLFKTAEDEWKPLSEVRSQVGRFLYTDLLRSIDASCTAAGIALADDRFENLDKFYPSYRALAYMQKAEKSVHENGANSPFVSHATSEENLGALETKASLAQQWELKHEVQTLKNCERSTDAFEGVFAMDEESWAPIQLRGPGNLTFFQLKSKWDTTPDISQDINRGQELLGSETKRLLMEELLVMIEEAGGITIKRDLEST